MPKENTMSEQAVRLEACTVCGRPLPPVFGFPTSARTAGSTYSAAE